MFSTLVCSRESNLCRGYVHIHGKNESGDGVLTFRYVEVVMALEKTGVHMFDKQCDGEKNTPFIHLFNTYLSVTMNQSCFLSNGDKIMN